MSEHSATGSEASSPPLAEPMVGMGTTPSGQTGRVVLRASGLRRCFGKVAAVDDLHLEVREGEIYGFLGINGAGKTTTIRVLMGIVAAEAGTITLLGETERRTTVRQKQRIGYVSQEQTFYPWMTGAQLGRFVGAFYPTWDGAEFERLLRVLEVPADRRVSQLSGGMKAKLALALAIAPRPALLVLDEPTAGLDPVARREFMQIIVAQARQHGRTTFFSSHLIDEVERCADRVGIIHQGRMRYEGALSELCAQVRRVKFGPALPGTETGWETPAEFAVWREEWMGPQRTLVLRATREAWACLVLPAGAIVEGLSLEEIFIACAGSRLVQL